MPFLTYFRRCVLVALTVDNFLAITSSLVLIFQFYSIIASNTVQINFNSDPITLKNIFHSMPLFKSHNLQIYTPQYSTQIYQFQTSVAYRSLTARTIAVLGNTTVVSVYIITLHVNSWKYAQSFRYHTDRLFFHHNNP